MFYLLMNWLNMLQPDLSPLKDNHVPDNPEKKQNSNDFAFNTLIV